MSVTLRQPLTLEECQQVRLWRNAPDVLPMLRTGYKTEEEQIEFYRDVILADKPRNHEYFAVEVDGQFAGMAGLTHLTRVEGEISLVLDPVQRYRGVGEWVVDALIVEAQKLGLIELTGECYAEGNLAFWTKQIHRRPARLHWRWYLPNLTSEGYGHGV